MLSLTTILFGACAILKFSFLSLFLLRTLRLSRFGLFSAIITAHSVCWATSDIVYISTDVWLPYQIQSNMFEASQILEDFALWLPCIAAYEAFRGWVVNVAGKRRTGAWAVTAVVLEVFTVCLAVIQLSLMLAFQHANSSALAGYIYYTIVHLFARLVLLAVLLAMTLWFVRYTESRRPFAKVVFVYGALILVTYIYLTIARTFGGTIVSYIFLYFFPPILSLAWLSLNARSVVKIMGDTSIASHFSYKILEAPSTPHDNCDTLPSNTSEKDPRHLSMSNASTSAAKEGAPLATSTADSRSPPPQESQEQMKPPHTDVDVSNEKTPI